MACSTAGLTVNVTGGGLAKYAVCYIKHVGVHTTTKPNAYTVDVMSQTTLIN